MGDYLGLLITWLMCEGTLKEGVLSAFGKRVSPDLLFARAEKTTVCWLLVQTPQSSRLLKLRASPFELECQCR
jgi:hypothetical protein